MEAVPVAHTETGQAPVMTWQEHASRSLFKLHLGDCKPHLFSWMQPAAQEPMYRGDCEWCRGTVWVNAWPAQRQGASFEELATEVERILG